MSKLLQEKIKKKLKRKKRAKKRINLNRIQLKILKYLNLLNFISPTIKSFISIIIVNKTKIIKPF